MKIGIPRALLYYYYFPFWKTLFEKLGCEVILSDETNSKIISDGCSVTVSEICVPIKIFNGHVINLDSKNVDYIFVPQFHKVKKEWYCPKFLGLPELVEYSVVDLKTELLIVDYVTKDDSLNSFNAHLPLLSKLNVTRSQLEKALKDATKSQQNFRKLCKMGYTIMEVYEHIFDGKDLPSLPAHEITIALLGYVNNVYDNFVSMNTIKKLRDTGAKVITFDMLDEKLIRKNNKESKQPFWIFTRKIFNASKHLITNRSIDGIIHMTAFGCGPDSIIGKLMEFDCEDKQIPFITVRVDEHTGDNHVNTRLEAFTDMIKISKRKAITQ